MSNPVVSVEVDLYSGIPNPSFQLEGEDATTLLARLHNLSDLSGPVGLPGLGMRGFIVRSEGLIAHVLNGVVDLQTDRGALSTSDTEGVYSFLESSARSHGIDL